MFSKSMLVLMFFVVGFFIGIICFIVTSRNSRIPDVVTMSETEKTSVLIDSLISQTKAKKIKWTVRFDSDEPNFSTQYKNTRFSLYNYSTGACLVISSIGAKTIVVRAFEYETLNSLLTEVKTVTDYDTKKLHADKAMQHQFDLLVQALVNKK
jgi:hypothetical protein